jgi:hypothetical protein
MGGRFQVFFCFYEKKGRILIGLGWNSGIWEFYVFDLSARWASLLEERDKL